MTKEDIIVILKKYQTTGSSGVPLITNGSLEPLAIEIVSLFHTGQTDVVIDPKKEMIDGFNQAPITGEPE